MTHGIPPQDHLTPEEIRDAFAYGIAQLSHMPIEQLRTEAATVRAARGLPPSSVSAPLDALAYGLAKFLHTPLGQLKAEADAFHAPQIGAVPIRGQLSRLDRLVAAHETYWVALAQKNPRSQLLRDFVRSHWDPWYTRWLEARPRLDRRRSVVDATGTLSEDLVPASDETISAFVREAASGLAGLRQHAAHSGIPMPDLGAARHGFANINDERVAGLSGDEGEPDMTYGHNYVGADADGQSYPEVAARAVRSVHEKQRSPLYGYIRSGINQKIYLFPRLEDARAWFDQVQLQSDHDYAAVFSAANLRAPIAGMEHFMRANVSGDQVGNLWPFLLGLPLGGLGGYFLRRWQEPAGARAQVPPLREAVRPLLPGQPPPPPPVAPEAPAPKTAGDYGDGGYSVGCPSWVGGPWVDLVGQGYDQDDYDDGSGYSVGCPSWVGAQDDTARRSEWPQTRALIQSAISDVTSYASTYPAEAYVWSLDAPSRAPYAGQTPGSVVMLEATSNIVPFSSQREALTYLREVAQSRPVALAMFERSSTHWPNPVAWRKSSEPEHASVIAQHVARRSPTQTSGVYLGADIAVGAAVDDVRRRAQALAERRAGTVIGVIHTSKDNLWHTYAFRSADDADDWLNTATQDQNAYTYAAYFDKEGDSWPAPYIEKLVGFRQPKSSQEFRRTGIVGNNAEWWP